VAATVPAQPSAPTTSVSNIYVKIAWSAPYANSGTINGYQVYIANTAGTFLLESTYCYGLSAPVLTQMYCLVPMSVLQLPPYNLPFDAIVLAQVAASN
jgi:hypothetical protein